MKSPSGQALSAFLRSLQVAVGKHVFNPWTTHDTSTDLHGDAPTQRIERLKAHLSSDASFVFVGEAPGYQGCHVSGIPFTSERLLMAGRIPRITIDGARLSSRNPPWSEPSATVVWKTLHALGIAEHAVLWNAFPWHPHKAGTLHSNRTPTRAEREAGLPVLGKLLDLYPTACVFAVGKNAQLSLEEVGRTATPLRHPSMGGATKFAQQLREAVI